MVRNIDNIYIDICYITEELDEQLDRELIAILVTMLHNPINCDIGLGAITDRIKLGFIDIWEKCYIVMRSLQVRYI